MRAYLFNCQLKKEKIKNDEITTQEIIFDKDNLKLGFKGTIDTWEIFIEEVEKFEITMDDNPEAYNFLQEQKTIFKDLITIYNCIIALE